MIIILLLLCFFYDDPLYFIVMHYPSIPFAVFAEIPASAFYTALLTYWLLGLAFVRKKASELDARTATVEDITGKLSKSRLLIITGLATFAFIW